VPPLSNVQRPYPFTKLQLLGQRALPCGFFPFFLRPVHHKIPSLSFPPPVFCLFFFQSPCPPLRPDGRFLFTLAFPPPIFHLFFSADGCPARAPPVCQLRLFFEKEAEFLWIFDGTLSTTSRWDPCLLRDLCKPRFFDPFFHVGLLAPEIEGSRDTL